MTPTADKINSNDAQQALDSVNEMERIAFREAMPPIWLGIVMALIVGTLVFLIAAGLRDYYVFPIIALPLLLAYRKKKTKAIPKTNSGDKKALAAIIGVTVMFLALISGAWLLKGVYGLTWAPVVAGVITVIGVFYLSISERRGFLNKISGK